MKTIYRHTYGCCSFLTSVEYEKKEKKEKKKKRKEKKQEKRPLAPFK